MKKGLFIAFEGIDGCGKSTQVWLLGKYLAELNKHNDVIITRNPWKNTQIRKLLRQTDDPYSEKEKLAKMYIDDRRENVKAIVLPMVRKGAHVVSDRYSFSTLAYQQTQGMKLKTLIEMHKGLIIPDIIFIIDVPAEIAIQRMKKDNKRTGKNKEHKFEKSKEFITKLRENYLNLKSLKNHRVFVIDATKKPEEIFQEQIKPIIDKIYNQIYS